MTFLFYAGLFQFVDGAQAVLNGMLRGLGDTRVPMIVCGIGYWAIGLPLGVALAFPGGLGGAGIWIGLATGLAAVAVMLTVRWLSRARREHGPHPRPSAAIATAAPVAPAVTLSIAVRPTPAKPT